MAAVKQAKVKVDDRAAIGALKLFCILSFLGVIFLILLGLGFLLLAVGLFFLWKGLRTLEPKYREMGLPAALVLAAFALLSIGILMLIVVIIAAPLVTLMAGGNVPAAAVPAEMGVVSGIQTIVGIIAILFFLLAGLLFWLVVPFAMYRVGKAYSQSNIIVGAVLNLVPALNLVGLILIYLSLGDVEKSLK